MTLQAFMKRVQLEELRTAHIEGLEECPLSAPTMPRGGEGGGGGRSRPFCSYLFSVLLLS